MRPSAESPPWWRPYVWWPVVAATMGTAAVALGAPMPRGLRLVACLALPVLVAARSPLRDAPLPTLLRGACFLVPLVVVHTLHPEYTAAVRSPLPAWDTLGPALVGVWAQVARAELAALVAVELLLAALTRWTR